MTEFIGRVPVTMQVLGLIAFLAGLYLVAGLGVTLLAGGLAVTLWGAVAESSQTRDAGGA